MPDFLIQLGHPKILELADNRFEEVREVFPRLFAENEESSYLIWHDIPIRIHYTYELYANFDDFVAMLWVLYDKPEGANKVTWMTDTLFMEWELRWQGEALEIKSTFEARSKTYDLYAEALSRNPVVTMGKSDFLAEWNTLALQILKCFDAAKVIITHQREHLKLELLKKVAANFHQYGVLYTRG